MVKKTDISEPIRISFDEVGNPNGFVIECDFYRIGGKYYMSEDVIIPLDTMSFDIRVAIRKHRRLNEFITVGKDLRGVPFLVSAGE